MSHIRSNGFRDSLLCLEGCQQFGDTLELATLALENSGHELVQTHHLCILTTSCYDELRDRFLLDVTNQYGRENSNTDTLDTPKSLPYSEHENQQYFHFSMGQSMVV